MTYFYRYNNELIGWKANGLYDQASEHLKELLQSLSMGRPDNGVRVGLVETVPVDPVTRWVTPNFTAIKEAKPKTLEQLLLLLV